MQLQQLVYFLAVARACHFTRAAEQVHVAQPSLSKQIQNLEAELGSELFHRARGNVSLTPAGEVLVPLAKRILADVETARLQVHELAELRSGRLRLGATPSLCTGLVADLEHRALVMFRDGYDLRAMTLAECQRAGFTPRFAIEGGEMDAVLSFVEAGLGVAVVPSMVLPSRPRLRGVPFVAPVPRRTIALAHRSDVRPPRAAEAFRVTLLGLIDDAHARGALPAGVEMMPRAQPGSGIDGSTPVIARTSPRTTRNASPSG